MNEIGSSSRYVAAVQSHAPEQNPFKTVFVDLTHRCNMECRNCYIPNRDLPDMDVEWLYGILRRLPNRTRIRLVGAEPTVRGDLPEIIRQVRRLGHLPILMTNGLRLATPGYAGRLKQAGLRTVHLSLNGGLSDDHYLAIDDLACASKKLQALDNLLAERLYITAGMILVREVNAGHLPDFLSYLRGRGVQELHVRSVGQFARHMPTKPFDLDEMIDMLCLALGANRSDIEVDHDGPAHAGFRCHGMRFQATQWPEMGSRERGRLTPDGRIAPCFEHLVAQDGEY